MSSSKVVAVVVAAAVVVAEGEADGAWNTSRCLWNPYNQLLP